MSFIELSEQELLRRETLNQIRQMGIDPYPAALYPVDDYAKNIKENLVLRLKQKLLSKL